jgi:Bacterial membrane protein YfhO
MRPRGRVADVAIAIAFALAAVALWKWRIIDPATEPYRGGVSAGGDLYVEVYPMSKIAADWIRAGRLPLWNPFQFCGHPFLATGIYGVLYPLNVLHLLLPTEVAMEAAIALHLALAGIFMYAFARVVGMARQAAVGAGIVFMWSGFVVGEGLWFSPAIAAAPWLPLALLAVEKILATRRAVWAAVLAVAIALPILAGYPQTWTYGVYAVALYTAMRMLERLWYRGAAPGRVVALLALGMVLAIALMAAQLLPQAELQRMSPRRAGGLSAEQAVTYAPPAADWFLAQPFNSEPSEPQSGYVGIATLLAIALSVFALRGRSRILTFWILGLFSAGVALGPGSPFFTVHGLLPLMKWFRGPQRILYLYAVSAAFLAGVGIDALAAGRQTLPMRRRLIAFGALMLFALTAWHAIAMPPRSVVYLACGLGLSGAALTISDVQLRRVAVAALVVLIAWDLFHAVRNPYFHPYHEVQSFDAERPLWNFVRDHQDYGRTYIKNIFNLPPIMAKQGTLQGIYSITDYEPLTLRRYERFYRLLESTHRPSSFTFMGDLRADPAVPGFALLDLMSVRYIVAPKLAGSGSRPLDRWRWKWRPVSELTASHYTLYENTNVLPRSYVAYSAVRVPGEDDALATISAPGFEPRATVVLEDAPAIAGAGQDPRPITPARILRYEPTEVVLEADAASPGHLVLTDTYYPGWYATVDDAAAPILRANYLFRAVAIGSGHHTVVFRYAPRSFAVGAGLSLAALVCVVALVGRELART